MTKINYTGQNQSVAPFLELLSPTECENYIKQEEAINSLTPLKFLVTFSATLNEAEYKEYTTKREECENATFPELYRSMGNMKTDRVINLYNMKPDKVIKLCKMKTDKVIKLCNSLNRAGYPKRLAVMEASFERCYFAKGVLQTAVNHGERLNTTSTDPLNPFQDIEAYVISLVNFNSLGYFTQYLAKHLPDCEQANLYVQDIILRAITGGFSDRELSALISDHNVSMFIGRHCLRLMKYLQKHHQDIFNIVN